MSTRDPGLQPERTALAWQRTALSAAVVAVLLARGGLAGQVPLDIAAGACATGVVVVAAIAARSRSTDGASRLCLLVTTAGVVATGVLLTVRLLIS